jgi:hypothetical protein
MDPGKIVPDPDIDPGKNRSGSGELQIRNESYVKTLEN